MTPLQLFGLKRCSTCVKALKWLDAQGWSYEFTDYRDHPIDAAHLQAWQAQLGGWEKLVNRASMTWRNLPDTDKSPADDSQWLALIAAHPTLIKRPVLVQGDQVMVGFSEKKYSALEA